MPLVATALLQNSKNQESTVILACCMRGLVRKICLNISTLTHVPEDSSFSEVCLMDFFLSRVHRSYKSWEMVKCGRNVGAEGHLNWNEGTAEEMVKLQTETTCQSVSHLIPPIYWQRDFTSQKTLSESYLTLVGAQVVFTAITLKQLFPKCVVTVPMAQLIEHCFR